MPKSTTVNGLSFTIVKGPGKPIPYSSYGSQLTPKSYKGLGRHLKGPKPFVFTWRDRRYH